MSTSTVQVVLIDNYLQLAFDYCGVRCVESIGLPNSDRDLAVAYAFASRIAKELSDGTFRYSLSFPSSATFVHLKRLGIVGAEDGSSLFRDYAERWYGCNIHSWRAGYARSIRQSLDSHLIPAFGQVPVTAIDTNAILDFRAQLLTRPHHNHGRILRSTRVNQLMKTLRVILNDASRRYGYGNPWINITKVREPIGQPDPLSLNEVERFLDVVEPQFKIYYETRFLTGLRSSEIHGLDWEDIDLEDGVIHIKKAFVGGELVGCKTDASYRTVKIGSRICEALLRHQHAAQFVDGAVFRGAKGRRLHNPWVTRAIWYPALEAAGIARRRPLHSRHTTVTLWLAAGESPQWIAQQMGFKDSQLVFDLYGAYFPRRQQVHGALLTSYRRGL